VVLPVSRGMGEPLIVPVELGILQRRPAPEPIHARAWPLAGRVGFRFLVAYFALVNCMLIRNALGPGWWTFDRLWDRLVPWIGRHILHIGAAIPTQPTGSGDGLFQWLRCGLWIALAAVAAAIWSIADRRRTRYDRLAGALRVFLRYHLAAQMLAYGLSKVFKVQFPAPGPGRLTESFGDSSPMGLLWTFMGASTAYTAFTGGAEVLGGVLLLFRRTATLGALVILGVMTNVVMLNFSYDVPVKLLSLHLLVMAVILMAPDARGLADLLVLHRPAAPRPFAWVPKRAGARWARRIVKTLVVGGLIAMYLRGSVEAVEEWGDHAPKPSTYGSYDVETQTREGKLVPPLLTDPTRFRSGFIDVSFGGLRTSDGIGLTFRLPSKDGADGQVDAFLVAKHQAGRMTFSRPDAEHVVLEGTIGGEKMLVRIKRRDSPSLLMSRGFHLVSEFPFNR
jgi:uncharacterized membrane protein YphA (DoxX/SURF4 family)